MRELLGGLRPSDTFNVLLFSGSNRMLAPQSVPATQRQHRTAALHTLGRRRGGGGTEIVPALQAHRRDAEGARTSRAPWSS